MRPNPFIATRVAMMMCCYLYIGISLPSLGGRYGLRCGSRFRSRWLRGWLWYWIWLRGWFRCGLRNKVRGWGIFHGYEFNSRGWWILCWRCSLRRRHGRISIYNEVIEGDIVILCMFKMHPEATVLLLTHIPPPINRRSHGEDNLAGCGHARVLYLEHSVP